MWQEVINLIGRLSKKLDKVICAIEDLSSGGGAVTYYEFYGLVSTDGTSSPGGTTLTVLTNTFPGTWTIQPVATSAIQIDYDPADLDFLTPGKLYSSGGTTYNAFTTDVVGHINASGDFGFPDSVILVLYKVTSAGTVAAGSADLELGLLQAPLPVHFRYYI